MRGEKAFEIKDGNNVGKSEERKERNIFSTVLLLMIHCVATGNCRYSPDYIGDYRKVVLKFKELSQLHYQSSDKYY